MNIYVDSRTGEQVHKAAVSKLAKERSGATGAMVLKAEKFWDAAYLAQWDVDLIEVIQTAPPSVQMPYRLSGEHTWDKSNPKQWVQEWTVISPTLEQAKRWQAQQIQQAYHSAKITGVEARGYIWRGGLSSANGIASMIDLAQDEPTVLLQPMRAEPVLVPLDDARHIVRVLRQAYQPIYMKKEAKFRDIESAQSVSEVLAVTWDD